MAPTPRDDASFDDEDLRIIEGSGYDPRLVVPGSLTYGPASILGMVRRRLTLQFRYAPAGEPVRTVRVEL